MSDQVGALVFWTLTNELTAARDDLTATRARLAEAEAAVEAMKKFKAYVHKRLDQAGIPTHPDGPHSKEGCRVGDRLDIALAAAPANTDGGT